MRTKKIITAIILLFSGVVLGGYIFSGFNLVRPGYADVTLGAKNPPVTLNGDATAFSQSFIKVAEQVTPSIVQINVVAESEKNPHGDMFMFPFKDFNIPKEQLGSGSGIIISDEGHILTNNHVVDNAKQVTVILHDKRKFEAKVIGNDKLTDLAVIKITGKDLPVAFLGDSDKLKVGQWVMAIGNPMSLTSTVTAGIISALNRGQLNLMKDSYAVEDFIQTDAAINPGNSGGALVDLSGAVIGVNSAIASRTGTYEGYGFAIPINLAKSVAKDLIANGKISRGYIGVQIREVDAALAKSLGLDKPEGVIIEGITKGSAAEKTDIKRGDVILKVDDIEVSQPNQLQSYVASKRAGSDVSLTLFRDGSKITRKVTLKAREEGEKTELASGEDISIDDNTATMKTFDNIGLTVRNLTQKEKEDAELESGVKITKVKPYSKAQMQGLGDGLIITKAARKKVNSVSELRSIIESNKGGAVLLEVTDSKGQARYVGLEIPE